MVGYDFNKTRCVLENIGVGKKSYLTTDRGRL